MEFHINAVSPTTIASGGELCLYGSSMNTLTAAYLGLQPMRIHRSIDDALVTLSVPSFVRDAGDMKLVSANGSVRYLFLQSAGAGRMRFKEQFSDDGDDDDAGA